MWDSYWVPVYSKAGVMTAKKTNLAYSVDLARGIDVYRVDLPGTAWDTNVPRPSPRPVAAGSRRARSAGCVGVLLVARAPAPSYGEPRRRRRRLTHRRP